MAPVVDIGGAPVLVEGGDTERCDAIAGLLGDLSAHPRPPRLTIHYLREAPSLPARSPDHTSVDLRVWRRGDEVVLEDASGMRARAVGSSAWIGGCSENLDVAFRRLFHPVVTHLLATERLFVLHAAAMVAGSQAWLALGRTGRGKSTLGLAALRAGWKLLGDDMAVVRRADTDDPALEVAGIARRAMVPADLEPPDQRDGRAVPNDPRGRRELAPGNLTPGWFPLAGVVVSTHGASVEGGLRRLEPRPVLYEVLSSFAGVTHPRFLREFFPLAASASRLPVWELAHSSETMKRLKVAGESLNRVAAAVVVDR